MASTGPVYCVGLHAHPEEVQDPPERVCPACWAGPAVPEESQMPHTGLPSARGTDCTSTPAVAEEHPAGFGKPGSQSSRLPRAPAAHGLGSAFWGSRLWE